MSQHINFFDSEKLKAFLVLLTGFEPSTFGSPVHCSNHSVTPESEVKSEDRGFDPLEGQGKRQFFIPSVSTRVQTCLCLTSLRLYGTHPNMCARYRSRIHLS